MKLQQLFDESGHSNFVIIHDNKDAKGETLLVEFIKQNVKLGNKTDLLCIERNLRVLENLPVANNFNIHLISDNLFWLRNYKDSSDSIWTLFQELQNSSKSHSKTVVVVDSLSLLILLYPETCYRKIHNILKFFREGSKQFQLICLLHSDVIRCDKKTTLMFERLASTNIYVEQLNKESRVIIKHRKASGRVVEITEQFYFDQSLNLMTKEIVKEKETSTEDDSKDWITKDLTFKLDLEDKEKQARSELVLPYLKTSNQGGSGDIYYEPDATDDWDEEDPDDDLNI